MPICLHTSELDEKPGGEPAEPWAGKSPGRPSKGTVSNARGPMLWVRQTWAYLA